MDFQEYQEMQRQGNAHKLDKYSAERFPTGMMYKEFITLHKVVTWRKLFYSNLARSRALFNLWMLCLGRLYTNDKLLKFGVINDGICEETESINHIFFNCPFAKETLKKVLAWLKIDHTPGIWEEELKCILQKTKGQKPSCRLLKCENSLCCVVCAEQEDS